MLNDEIEFVLPCRCVSPLVSPRLRHVEGGVRVAVRAAGVVQAQRGYQVHPLAQVLEYREALSDLRPNAVLEFFLDG